MPNEPRYNGHQVFMRLRHKTSYDYKASPIKPDTDEHWIYHADQCSTSDCENETWTTFLFYILINISSWFQLQSGDNLKILRYELLDLAPRLTCASFKIFWFSNIIHLNEFYFCLKMNGFEATNRISILTTEIQESESIGNTEVYRWENVSFCY